MCITPSLKMAKALPTNILTLSAKSPEELEALIEKYKIFLRSSAESSSSFADIAFSTNIDNQNHPHRIAVIGKTCEEIANNLDKRRFEHGVATEPPEKLCFTFSGNGSCYHQMAQTLYDTVPKFRQDFDEWADYIERRNPQISLHDVLFGDDASHVDHPINSCLTLEFVNTLISRLWNFWGIEPDCVLGHSLGEYAAACSAGILKFEDILTILLRVTAKSAGDLFPPGRMAVVLGSEETVENLVSQCTALIKSDKGSPWISVAGQNSPDQFVVAGCPVAIFKFIELAKNNGVRAVPLQVTAAYHSQGVDPVLDIIRDAGITFTYNKPKCEYISSLTGTLLENMPQDYWGTHVRSPIKFADAARTAYEECRARVYLEMGGQPVVSALMMQNVDELGGTEPIVCLHSMKKGKDDLETILGSVAKLYTMGHGPVNWTNFYKDLSVNLVDVPLTSEKFMHSSNIICPLAEEEMSEDAFWTQLDQASNKTERCDLLLRYVFQVMKRVLKSEEDLELDPDQEFRAIGIDSLLAIQMKTHLGKILGSQITLSFNDLIQCYTPAQLVQKLHTLIFNNGNNNDNSKKVEKEETKKLVLEDSVLWSHIKAVPTRPVVPLSEIKTYLVTGATGNLAPYIVLELANRPETEKIYCLVREGRDISAQQRLERHFKDEGIWDKLPDTSKLIAVQGNIVDERMGIDDIKYDQLAEEVDAVINCAVTSNHLAPYKMEDLKYGGVRAVNVIGVQRMLEFAGNARTKWVYHASTFLALWGKTGVHYDRMPEEWPRDFAQELDIYPNFGYAISKLIADSLVHQATQRGIPCKAFRFTKIGGDSDTGRQKVMQNHFFLKFLYYIVGGVMPNLDVPLQLMTVDACAKVSVRVFFDQRANPSDIYNLIAPYNVNELEVADLVEEFGPQLRILSQLSRIVEKFGEDGARQKWLEMSASGPLATVVEELDRTMGPNWWENPSSAFSNENVMEFIRSQFDYGVKIVPYKEYTEHLIADGEDSLIYHWIDFYTSEDSLFYLADKGTLPLQESWNKDQKHFLRWGKVEMLYPNLQEMIESPKDALRRDIQYTVDNAKNIFRHRYHKQ